MTTFNSLQLPIQGHRLIEASAGTGKTHAIVSLVLRILLGQDDNINALTIDKILIVTYTRAGTAELRERLHLRLREARDAFADKGVPQDTFLQELIGQSADRQKDAKILQAATEQLDEAAVFTIHGFCQRLLTKGVFESGRVLGRKFSEDDHLYRKRAVQDFWRQKVYPLSAELNRLIRSAYPDPDKLLKTLSGYINRELYVHGYQSGKSLQEYHEKLKVALIAVKASWRQDQVREEIAQSSISKSKTKKSGGHNELLDLMDAWVDSNELLEAKILVGSSYDTITSLLQRYARGTLLASDNLKKAGEPPQIEGFLETVDQALEYVKSLQVTFFGDALKSIRAGIMAAREADQTMGFDDLLQLTTDALDSQSGQRFSERTRTLYPVAFIDEFQDTDPKQWQIFSKIYTQNLPQASMQHALIMIGDPKQAIFAFRGANLHTYLQVRKSLPKENIVQIDVNWRSSPEMIRAIDALYREHPNPFVQEDIRFQTVRPAPQAEEGSFKHDNKPHPPLTFWSCPATKKAQDKEMLAKIAVGNFIRLLDGNTQIGNKELRPEDVAFLVNDRHEAELLRTELKIRGQASRWENRNSVFATSVAEDLHCVMEAALTPANERLVRTAMATSLFNLPLSRLLEIKQSEQEYLKHQHKFRRYRSLWGSQGIMVMLQNLIADDDLIAPHLNRGIDGARTLTDLRHLGELLQKQSLSFSSMEQLQRWFGAQLEIKTEAQSQQMRLESDSRLVQIVTVHSAKGLQYDLVVLPFGIKEASNAGNSRLIYEERDGNLSPVLDLQPDAKTKEAAGKEQLGESMRLLYVALTRAKYACFVGLTVTKKHAKSFSPALAHLLCPAIDGKEPEQDTGQRLDKLASQNPEIVHQEYDPDEEEGSTPRRYAQPNGSEQPIFATRSQFTGNINSRWGITSYSGLTRGHFSNHSADTPPKPGWQDEMHIPVIDNEALNTGKIDEIAIQFPKGARTGNCLHNILEQWPDAPEDEGDNIREQLLAHNIQGGWENKVQDVLSWLHKIRNTPLALPSANSADMKVSLKSLPPELRREEMQFYFPMVKVSTEHLCTILQRHGYASEPLNGAELQGFMQGFIDLTFEHDGQFWIMDYKSNYLGDQKAQYSMQAMEDTIRSHRYDLQFLLYSLAIRRLLQLHFPADEISRRTGGVCYLFLRGMDGAGQTGVYHHRPSDEILDELDALFEGKEFGALS